MDEHEYHFQLKYRKTRKNTKEPCQLQQPQFTDNLSQMQPDMDGDHCLTSQADYQHSDAPIRKNLIQVISTTSTNKRLDLQELIEIDRLHELINLRGLRIRDEQQNLADNSSPCQRLSKIGDEIVEQLVRN